LTTFARQQPSATKAITTHHNLHYASPAVANASARTPHRAWQTSKLEKYLALDGLLQ
jgi:hypothetical protein